MPVKPVSVSLEFSSYSYLIASLCFYPCFFRVAAFAGGKNDLCESINYNLKRKWAVNGHKVCLALVNIQGALFPGNIVDVCLS